MNKPEFKNIKHPDKGELIIYEGDKIVVGNNPIVPFIEGDGIGSDIWPATKLVIDSAVEKAYQGKKKIEWLEIYAGEKASNLVGEWLPEDTTEAIKFFKVAIKGPLTTPVGGGIRSLNVSLRQILDLYACVRPVKYVKGAPSPVKNPEWLDVVIFRENTEDVYAGIEYEMNSEKVKKVLKFLGEEMNANIRQDSGIGIKPISKFASERIIRKAIQYAIENNRNSVTMVHKGNIMKFTEGAFRKWGYELAEKEFKDIIISEKDLWEKFEGKQPEGKIILKDRIADAMFMNILKRTKEYGVIVTTNLNGDYLSDACAAQIGGLGLAPGANLSDTIALFEATHGTAPKYTGMDKVNPSSLLLSGIMMLEHLGWKEAARMIFNALETTVVSKIVTYDLETEGATIVKCSEFAQEIVRNL
ncbi:MAG: isocitrate dehydrogenase (NADP(+)) [Cyanobacteriota bacterium]